MAENLNFVPTLGTDWELLPDLNEIPPGSHADCILKESLRPLGAFSQTTRVEAGYPFGIITSFPDILPPAGQELISNTDAIFTRSEFLALRAVGDQATSLPLTGEIEERFSQIVDEVAAAAPPVVYHRMMDYNPDEFGFLEGNSDNNLRGSGKLLADEKLLDHELELIKNLKKAGKVVRVILPYISTPDEQVNVQEIVADAEPDEIGAMVERIEHAERIDDYPPVDFVVPGPSDLTAELIDAKRSDYRDNRLDTEQRIIDLSQRVADIISTRAYMITVKFLVSKILTPEGSNLTRNVYMPNQLIDQVNPNILTIES